ncbi:hypothetical protein GTP27_06800 [Pseudoduganella sp. CY13W]|uniref:Transporter substrate-binding domain-containing protein n=2 Tax=Duganella qianjiadongensis TaxID=2692176 RepID=A0ABW9VJX8_9BURK|nr:hypothetical protein [Duganella qianjiadongensis]
MASASTRMVYPLSSDGVDSRYDYDWAVLRTAMEKTIPAYGPYQQLQSGVAMSPQRVLLEMSAPQGRINVFVRATSPELEQRFLPIRLPVDRGLLGYRLLLIRAADQARFASVRTLDDLRQLRAGLGKGWADVSIFKTAGVEVVEGSSYAGLFGMLAAGRFDFYSRSADEALREFDERHTSHPGLAIESTLLLHYPLPRYFFVRRDAEGEQLARRITDGMEIMLKDGSLNALFQQHKGRLIKKTALFKRRLIKLPNRDLSPQTPLARSEWWINPLTGR